MRRTPSNLFWKSHSHHRWMNPVRRWWIHRQFARFLFLCGAGFYCSYALARRGPHGEPSFANIVIEALVTWAPNSIISQSAGDLASTPLLPRSVHQAAIRFFDKTCDISRYQTLQEYYLRDFEEARTVAEDAEYIVPCDGTVISVSDVTDQPRPFMVQVKGMAYALDEVLRWQFDPCPGDARRYAMVIQLGMADVHRVAAPVHMNVTRSTHIPGNLLPLSVTASKWLRRIYTSNERVSVIGNAAASGNFVGMALVGGLCEGRVRLAFDERVSTNVDYYLTTSVQRDYSACELTKAAPLGHFEMGSAVVLIVDVPLHLGKPTIAAGQRCKMGSPLVA